MEKEKRGAIPFFTNDNTAWIVTACCTLIFMGFAGSRALVSIGMVGLLVTALLSNPIGQTIKTYVNTKQLWVLSLFFWLVLVSGIYSADKGDWLNWVRIKLPYIALPLAFTAFKRLTEKQFNTILYVFVVTLFASCVFVLCRYALNFERMSDVVGQGGGIAMPYSRIRYTLMLAFSACCAVYLAERKFYLCSPLEKWLQLFIAAFAFIALHILAVRSGILAVYIGLVCWAAWYVYQSRRYWVAGVLIALMVAAPVLAYQFVPSFKNKINYMLYDYQQSSHGYTANMSDGIRVISNKLGIDIWLKNPVTGVGAGDLKTEMLKIYERDYAFMPPDNYRMPHNQLIWVMAGTGTIGLVLFLLAFLYPLFINRQYKNWLFVTFYLIIFSSFFTEHTLEEQIGTGFYLIFLLLLMNHLTPDEKTISGNYRA